MEMYLRGATKITISAIIIATSIRGCISVLEAPPPKPKLTGASGPNVNPLNQRANSTKTGLNRFYLHGAEIFRGSYCDISDRYMCENIAGEDEIYVFLPRNLPRDGVRCWVPDET